MFAKYQLKHLKKHLTVFGKLTLTCFDLAIMTKLDILF